jgi:type VI secretion system secreted protein VgrG
MIGDGDGNRDPGEALGGTTDASSIFGDASHVEYQLTLDGGSSHVNVTSVHLHETMGELCRGSVHAQTHEPIAEADLIGKDVCLTIERGAERRSFRGIVRSVSARNRHDGQHVSVDVVPALFMLGQTIDYRIYQDITVPDLVAQIVQELLGSRGRKVKSPDLTQPHPTHEYLVQHHETHLEFLTRLCDEEGIFFYFDHDYDDEEHEVLVLADSNQGRPTIPTSGASVPYHPNATQAERHEVATAFDHHEQLGATDAVVSGYDWTNPRARVSTDNTGRGRWDGPALEVHDHFDLVRHHRYSGTQYNENTVTERARHRIEQLDLARQQWNVDTTVLSAATGHTFRLQGSDHDGEYLIIAVTGRGEANREGAGSYQNTLHVVPKSLPYRPPPPRRRQVVGPETATVVGPAGEEIWTDKHGRIKVQFHWDRRGQNDEHSSAWLRCVHGWAGPSWGSIFIPRIGMEVMVMFLGGDPDRPVVTGCLYNGENTPPYTLPDEKTKSTIKSNSTIGGGGYNELRFEDKKGSEEVWIHAQKDFNEVVEHDHSTHVKHDQSNRVDHDQSELIGNDQALRVKHDRSKKIDNDETTKIGHDRTEDVIHDETVTVHNDRTHHILHDDTLNVTNGRTLSVLNGQTEKILNGNTVSITGDRNTQIKEHDNLTVTSQYNVEVGAHWKMKCSQTQIFADGSQIFAEAPRVLQWKIVDSTAFLHLQSGQVQIKGNDKIVIQTTGSKIEMTPDEINIQAPTIKINGANLVDIDGALVKIKC